VRTAWIFHEHVFEVTESNLVVNQTYNLFIFNSEVIIHELLKGFWSFSKANTVYVVVMVTTSVTATRGSAMIT
jgi:hypothetical protein